MVAYGWHNTLFTLSLEQLIDFFKVECPKLLYVELFYLKLHSRTGFWWSSVRFIRKYIKGFAIIVVYKMLTFFILRYTFNFKEDKNLH